MNMEFYSGARRQIQNFRILHLRNPGRDISFPIFTRKEIETKRIRKEIETIISRLNHILCFLSNIGAPVAQWVKRWPTDLADRVRFSLGVKSSQP